MGGTGRESLRSLWKKRQKDWKSHKILKFVLRLHFLVMSIMIPKVSLVSLPKHKLNKDDTIRHTKWTGKSEEASTLHKQL